MTTRSMTKDLSKQQQPEAIQSHSASPEIDAMSTSSSVQLLGAAQSAFDEDLDEQEAPRPIAMNLSSKSCSFES